MELKKLNLTQQNQTHISIPKDTIAKNKPKKPKPGLVIWYDIWPGNG